MRGHLPAFQVFFRLLMMWERFGVLATLSGTTLWLAGCWEAAVGASRFWNQDSDPRVPVSFVCLGFGSFKDGLRGSSTLSGPVFLSSQACMRLLLWCYICYCYYPRLIGPAESPMRLCVCTLRYDWAIPWTVAHQAPLSTGFFSQDYWSGLPFPPPGDLPNPGIKPACPASPALAGGFLTTSIPNLFKDQIPSIKYLSA